MSGPREIAVVRALGGIGDVLCVVPALKRLRAAVPDARVTYIGLPQVESVVARYPALVDRFLPFPGFPGVPEHRFEAGLLTRWLDDRRDEAPFDLAIQLHGSGSVTNVFTALLEAERTFGYHLPGLWKPDAASPAFPDALPEVARWTSLVDALRPRGAQDGVDDALEFPVSDEERVAVRALVPSARYAVVHTGASDPRRRWSPQSFAEVAHSLGERGLQVVLTGVTSESGVVAAVQAHMRSISIDLCSRTTLGQTAALIEGAAVVVTNDTGVSHLAAALRVPSVVIFIASDPARWAPADGALHLAVGEGVGDVPVGSGAVAREASEPSVDDVFAAAIRLLDGARAQAPA